MFELKSTYFNTAYLGPTPIRARDNIQERLKQCMDPVYYESANWFENTDRIRERVAKLLGCKALNIAFSTSVSELVSHVANGMNLKPGDEVVLMEGDYPSLVLPWMVLAEQRGFGLRFLDLETYLNPEKFRRALTAKTKFAASSHVQFNTGMQMPVAALGKAARENGVLFMADVSQSFGGMTLSQEILAHCDILAGVAYKWLLGPYGSAWGYFSDAALERVPRTHASWLNNLGSHSRENLLNYSTQTFPGARRFDRGEAPSFLICAGLEGSLDVLLETGLANIESRNRRLTDLFLSELPKSFVTAAPHELRSNIVCLKPGGKDPLAMKRALAERNIIASLREGNLRFSFHFFNTEEQVQEALKILR